MSTTASLPLNETRTDRPQFNGENSSYRIGDERTDSVEQPTIKPSTHRLVEVGLLTERKIEEIKQRWNGVVLEVGDNNFKARLKDLTQPANPDEIVELSCDEIEPRDQHMIQPGALFIWQIGYRSGPKYPRERFSKIGFRRLPKWTEDEIALAEARAKELTDYFLTDSN